MLDIQEIRSLIEEKLRESDNYLVDVSLGKDNMLIVEIDNDEGVNIDDCAELSRHIESKLDRDKEDFELEVGSTGITAPFKIARQYIKNIGNEVEMLLSNGTKLKGILTAADSESATIAVEKKVKIEGHKRKSIIQEKYTYEYNDIKYTKYLIKF